MYSVILVRNSIITVNIRRGKGFDCPILDKAKHYGTPFWKDLEIDSFLYFLFRLHSFSDTRKETWILSP